MEGFCPSFVTVLGGKVRKASGMSADKWPTSKRSTATAVPELPEMAAYSLMVTGVGGTGVVTIGALLGMAAHIEDMGVCIVDQLGFAQKGGSVVTHVRLAKDQDQIHASRVNSGMADAFLACDMLVAGSDKVLDSLDPARTRAVINTEKNYTGDFTRNTEIALPRRHPGQPPGENHQRGGRQMFNASQVAVKLLGDSLGANLMLTGFAWQRGLIPDSRGSDPGSHRTQRRGYRLEQGGL